MFPLDSSLTKLFKFHESKPCHHTFRAKHKGLCSVNFVECLTLSSLVPEADPGVAQDQISSLWRSSLKIEDIVEREFRIKTFRYWLTRLCFCFMLETWSLVLGFSSYVKWEAFYSVNFGNVFNISKLIHFIYLLSISMCQAQCWSLEIW